MKTETKQPIWKQYPELMQQLIALQNTVKNQNQDILTIVGFFTTKEELEKHIEANS